MPFLYYIKGFLIGLAIAAPIGPIAILCMKTTLTYGRRAGFATGSGAAFADTFYATLGVFGVTLITGFLEEYSQAVRFAGGILLMAVGLRIIFAKPAQKTPEGVQLTSNLVQDFITAFFMTLANPATIFAFIAVFASFGIHADGDYIRGAVIVSGVLTGALSWWYFLSFSVSFFKTHVSDESLHKINILSGFFIALFGLIAFLSAFKVFSFS